MVRLRQLAIDLAMITYFHTKIHLLNEEPFILKAAALMQVEMSYTYYPLFRLLAQFCLDFTSGPCIYPSFPLIDTR